MKRQGQAVNKGKNKKQKWPLSSSPRVIDAGVISALVTTKLAEQPVPIWVHIFNTYFTNEDLINIVGTSIQFYRIVNEHPGMVRTITPIVEIGASQNADNTGRNQRVICLTPAP